MKEKGASGYRRERLDRAIKARCDDIFALSSYREITYLVAPRALPAALLLIFPLLTGVVGLYWERVVSTACVIALLAISWDWMASAQLISLGQALFFGVGAYLSAYLSLTFGWPIYLTIPMATLCGALLCTALLLPTLRMRGVYFALFTLIMPLLLARLIEATKILGGTEGLSGLAPLPSLWVELYVPPVALLVCLFGLRRLSGTDYGVILKGIRDNDRAVMAAGINIYWFKAQVLFVAAIIGAFAGAFFAHYYQVAGLSSLALDYSILPMASAIVGGVGTLAGSVIGAFILVPIFEALRAFGTLRIVFYCLVMVVFIVGLPEGVFPYLRRKYHQFERVVSVEAEE